MTLSQSALADRLNRSRTWIRNEGARVTGKNREGVTETWQRMGQTRIGQCVGYQFVTPAEAPAKTPTLCAGCGSRACPADSSDCLQCEHRNPGIDPKTGQYSTGQMMWDEMNKGDTGQPLFD